MRLYTLELNVTGEQLSEIETLLGLTVEWDSTNKYKPVYADTLNPFTNEPVGTVKALEEK